MIDVGQAVAYLDLDTTGFSSGFKSAYSELAIFSKESATADDKLKGVGNTMTSVGSTMTKAFTVPLGIGSALVSKFAIDFEKDMAKVATNADTTQVSLEDLSGGVQKVAMDVGYSTSDLSQGLYQIMSATGDTANSLGYLNTAAELAKGGFTDVTSAVDGGTSVMNAYGDISTSAFQKVADVMVMTQNVGKTTVAEMATSIGQVTPYSAALGVSFEQVGAAVATITSNGKSTAETMTQLKATFSELSKDGMQGADNFRAATGVSFAEFIKQGGTMQQALQALASYAKSRGKTIMDMFGSVEAASTALTLTTQQGATKFNSSLTSMQNASGATKKAFETMSDTTAGGLERLKSSAQVLGISLGEALLPIIQSLVDWLQGILDWLNSLDESTKSFIMTIVLVVVTIGPLILIIGKLILAYDAIKMAVMAANIQMNATMGIIGLIAAAATILIGIFSSLGNQSEELSKAAKEKLNVALDETAAKVKAMHEEESKATVETQTLKDKLTEMSQTNPDIKISLNTEETKTAVTDIRTAIGNLMLDTDNLKDSIGGVNDALANYQSALLSARQQMTVDHIMNLISAYQQNGGAIADLTTDINESLSGYYAYKAAVDGTTSSFDALIKSMGEEGGGQFTIQQVSNLLSGANTLTETTGQSLGVQLQSAADGMGSLQMASDAAVISLGGYDTTAQTTTQLITAEMLPAVDAVKTAYDNYNSSVELANETEQAQMQTARDLIQSTKDKRDAAWDYEQMIYRDHIPAIDAWIEIEKKYGTETTQSLKDAFAEKYGTANVGYHEAYALASQYTYDVQGLEGEFNNTSKKLAEERTTSITNANKKLQTDLSGITTGWTDDEIEAFAKLAKDSGFELDNGFINMLKGINAFVDNSKLSFTSAGEFIPTKFKEELDKMIPLLNSSANNTTEPSKGVGNNVSSGVAQGIKDWEYKAINAAVHMVEAAIAAAEKAGDISSPSKKMRDLVGKQLAAGVGIGFENEMDSVTTRVKKGIGGLIGVGSKMTLQPNVEYGYDLADKKSEAKGTTGGSDEKGGTVNNNTFNLISGKPLSALEASNEFEIMMQRMALGV